MANSSGLCSSHVRHLLHGPLNSLLWACNLATIVGGGEQLDEVGPSLRCFCC
jgi:hypothetical protein